MKLFSSSNQFAQKMRKPASIVFIIFPLACLTLLAFMWSDIWLTKPWLVGVSISYYGLAVAYLIFTFVVRMRVIAIIGLFLLLAASLLLFAASLFMWMPYTWIPYHWVLAVLLVPALFMAFYKRGNTGAAIALTTVAGIIALFVLLISALLGGFAPAKYEYHTSPDDQYVALEYSFSMMPSGADVFLCRVNGPFLDSERILYVANYSDFGGKIEWLNDSTVIIYGDRMDVFKDPIIYNYVPF